MDLNVTDRLLLGTVGWERPSWLTDYYPEDLPPDWRLAYYANDADCVLLPPAAWCDSEPEGLTEMLAETPQHLVFLLQAAAARPVAHCANLALFAQRQTVLLVERQDPAIHDTPQWVAQADGSWADPRSGAKVVRWSLEMPDLRLLRSRAETLDAHAVALLIDGPGASPGLLGELRTLLALLGKA